MKVFIYATESIYQGLHGIEDSIVVDCDTLQDADEYGAEMSLGLITSYGTLEEEYLDENGEFDEEAARENCNWVVWCIAEPYLHIDNSTLSYIACNEGYDTFINEYCDGIWEG